MTKRLPESEKKKSRNLKRVVTTNISDEAYDMLEDVRAAKIKDTGLALQRSDIIREAIEEYLSRQQVCA